MIDITKSYVDNMSNEELEAIKNKKSARMDQLLEMLNVLSFP